MPSGSDTSRPREILLTGIPTTPGIAIGEVFLYSRKTPQFIEKQVESKLRDTEISRFEEAVKKSQLQLRSIHKRLAAQAGETVADIFNMQILVLGDEVFLGEVRNSIRNDGINAEVAVQNTVNRWYDDYVKFEKEEFRQKAQDLLDIRRRLLSNLLGTGDVSIGPFDNPAVLVADDLLPSDVIHLLHKNVLAVATDLGGATSHTAILTRSLQVPAIVGLKEITVSVHNGDQIIVNGNSGKVFIHPEEQTLKSYRLKRTHFKEYLASLADIGNLAAETSDGHRVHLRANIELPHEMESVLRCGCDGIGLYRSEYLLLSRNRLPTEEEQYDAYRMIIEKISPHPVTIRTFDLGGDKIFPDMPHPAESNPFMGWRAIRVSLDQPLLLQTQLRAILRAAVHGNARVMFPMITDISELRKVKEHFTIAIEQLNRDGIPFKRDIPFGIMVELPSAVMTADRLAGEVDFFSIGTNDLTQFTLAIDRGNELVQGRYRALHPALLRMIRMTVDAGHAAGIEVGMCGELAASPLATMLLTGLELDELSVSPVALPEVKKIIRSMKFEDAQALAHVALNLHTADELEAFCTKEMRTRFADLPIWFSNNT